MPFPVNPTKQLHTHKPAISEQNAFEWQSCSPVEHSFTSKGYKNLKISLLGLRFSARNNLLSQTVPFPVKPFLHVQVYDPTALVQLPFSELHTWVPLHSSTSLGNRMIMIQQTIFKNISKLRKAYNSWSYICKYRYFSLIEMHFIYVFKSVDIPRSMSLDQASENHAEVQFVSRRVYHTNIALYSNSVVIRINPSL